ncbi:hypothetical protein ACQKKX_02485 [Neorhizobium sp. NPDC001467]|uniref:hypothetical protein n=1 Tax=Neorhizobium sp. NPDC001467 TaxID=3390595 RepID=UPI003CFF50F0
MNINEVSQKLRQTADHQPAKRIEAPTFYGSNFAVSWSALDVSMVLGRAFPATIDAGDMAGSMFGVLETQAIIQMSPQSAKDLMLVLQEGLKAYEEKYGVIKTDYSEARG